MYDQAYVFLVDAHPKCVCSTDNAGFTGEEIVLDLFFLRHRQAGVKMSRLPTVRAEEFRRYFGFFPPGTKDNGTGRLSLRQAVRKQLMETFKVARTRSCL